jgi:hypothetical protein
VPLAGRRPNIQRLPCQLGPPDDGVVPKDPFVREKFTRERSAAKKLAAEYFQRFPTGRLPDRGRELAKPAIAKYRIHHETVERIVDRYVMIAKGLRVALSPTHDSLDMATKEGVRLAKSAQPYNFKCPNPACGAEYVAVQRAQQEPERGPRCIECATPFLAKERDLHIHYEAAWPVTPSLPAARPDTPRLPVLAV